MLRCACKIRGDSVAAGPGAHGNRTHGSQHLKMQKGCAPTARYDAHTYSTAHFTQCMKTGHQYYNYGRGDIHSHRLTSLVGGLSQRPGRGTVPASPLTYRAHNSGLNGASMLSKPSPEGVVALLDHKRRTKRTSPLPLRTPQRGCELEGRRGERKRRPRARGGQKARVAHPSGSRPMVCQRARAVVS